MSQPLVQIRAAVAELDALESRIRAHVAEYEPGAAATADFEDLLTFNRGVMAYWETLTVAVGQVRELHRRSLSVCAVCRVHWPCPTIRALDGGKR